MRKIEPLNLTPLETYSLPGRHSKVSRRDFGRAWEKGGSLREFVARLPKILAGDTLRAVVAAWVAARRQGCQVLLGMGPTPSRWDSTPSSST